MKKALPQLFLTLVAFFLTWYLLSKINWTSVLNIEKVSRSTEEKLGDLMWEFYNTTEKEIHRRKIVKPIDSLLTHICEMNNIERDDIKLHIVMNSEVNAYTLPDRHLVIFSGLILDCENEEELCGVIGHELAHMEKRHVMKKLVKELGLSFLISATTGNSAGSQAAKELASNLASTAYDREMEWEADMTSLEYLTEAGIDPKPFADFMFRMAEKAGNMPKQLFWISTHPDSEERAEKILDSIKGKHSGHTKILSSTTWNSLAELLDEE